MTIWVRRAFALWICICCSHSYAQESNQPWEEYDKLIKARETLEVAGPDLMGDSVNLYNGALSFSVTDTSIPGNSKLPVALTRRYSVSNKKGYIQTSGGTVIGALADGAMADWEIDTPNLSGVFAAFWRDTRCTSTAPPATVRAPSGDFYPAEDYWAGNQANMPGGGEMLVANGGAAQPSTGGPYLWMTSSFTYFSCLSNIKNGTGEGFLAITSDGTRYWFDWMGQSFEPPIKGAANSSADVVRRRNVLYATRVEDRFGNFVVYNYGNAWNAPGRLNSIVANDGRQITLGYNGEGHVSTVSNGTQTWTYGYSYPSAQTGTLTSVILPDASRWSIDFAQLSMARFRYYKSLDKEEWYRSCTNPGQVLNGGAVSGTITHPAGATAVFTVAAVGFSRSNVPLMCANYQLPQNNPNDDVAYYPVSWDSYAIVGKQISGPGLSPLAWSYSYQPDISWFYPPSGQGMPVCQASGGCEAPQCVSDACAGSTTVIVTGPGGEWTRNVFGNSYRYNEGKLLRVERGTGPGNILRTETTTYELAQSGLAFPTPLGNSPHPRGDGFTSEFPRPARVSTVIQDGVTFNSEMGYDALVRPVAIRKWSSLGYSKSETTQYYDDTARWVLGQVRQVSNDAAGVMTRADYDPTTALPLHYYRFGQRVQSLGYNPDGTVSTATDGNNQTTNLSNWYRGVPRSISYADTTGDSAAVNDLGWIMSSTDENGFTTTYGYDAMGRIARVTYPTGDSAPWNDATAAFEQVAAAERGLEAGHWRMRRIQGNKQVNTYYDALWRPVLEEQFDAASAGTTSTNVAKRYDERGQLAFQSYPQRNIADFQQALAGTSTFYDALGRVTQVSQDSELGPLLTTTEYLPGFLVKTTNPRNQATTQRFEAYEAPTYDAPVSIESPMGVSTSISRNAFGSPVSVTQTGPDG